MDMQLFNTHISETTNTQMVTYPWLDIVTRIEGGGVHPSIVWIIFLAIDSIFTVNFMRIHGNSSKLNELDFATLGLAGWLGGDSTETTKCPLAERQLGAMPSKLIHESTTAIHW